MVVVVLDVEVDGGGVPLAGGPGCGDEPPVEDWLGSGCASREAHNAVREPLLPTTTASACPGRPAAIRAVPGTAPETPVIVATADHD